ncbi:MAG: cytochrome biosis protein [Proteobacteria bacterium]|nr:cytochrome biosis protein [Pseudomonadota bacterium]
MKPTRRGRVGALVAILVIASGLCGFGEPKRLKIGDPIPEVEVSDFHGKTMKLPQDLKGKVALLRFWALDCSQCSKQLLFSLDRLYQKYKENGFIPVAIHEGRPENCAEKLRQFGSLSFPMLQDELRTVALRFGLVGLPTTYIIDEKGVVREKIIGEVDLEQLEKILTTVLYKGGSYDSAH